MPTLPALNVGERFSRRSFLSASLSAAASGPLSLLAPSPVEYRFIQFHNQPANSPLHRALMAMWTRVGAETNGRVNTQVFPENRHLAGSDPAALQMLIAGEIHFFTLMGGILGTVVPVMDAQQMPFAFRSASHALRAMDGQLGAYLRDEVGRHGLHALAGGVFDNGMRQIGCVSRAIVTPSDLVGLRMRVPDGRVFSDLFRAFGAEPVALNGNQIYDGIKAGKVDAQENPLAIVELFKLYEVVRFVSMTNHMWSGFNLLAHEPTWKRLPQSIKDVIALNVRRSARAQREDQAAVNARLRVSLARRGLRFNDVDQPPFRAKLSGLYPAWKERLGTKCWSLLEAATS